MGGRFKLRGGMCTKLNEKSQTMQGASYFDGGKEGDRSCI